MKKLRQLIANLVPDKNTNIFRIIINGTDAALDSISTALKTFKRDRNILETNNPKALRSLVAENGFEPTLIVPATGSINMQIESSFFNEFGSNIYLPPYSQFLCKENGLIYFYNSNNPLKLGLINEIPLTEGLNIKKKINLDLFNNFNVNNNIEIIKIYLDESNISENSINLIINGIEYKQTKSLINKFNGNYFVVKHSNSMDSPIVVYITNRNKNIKIGANVEISYRLSNGLSGIVSDVAEFETDGIVDLNGVQISFNDDLIKTSVKSGFNFAGNGTSVDTMKSQIGFNHNIGIIFDSNSYKEFIWKYSNILLNKIELRNNNKSINDIYLTKKLFLNSVDEYIDYVKRDKFKFTTKELKEFSKIILENEYCLSTHNLFNAGVDKYAFQIEFNSKNDFVHIEKIKSLIYNEFMIFLRNKNHVFYVNELLTNYQRENKINFDYYLFSERIETEKIKQNINLVTDYKIVNTGNLPILFGNFYIANENYEQEQLFFDINFVLN